MTDRTSRTRTSLLGITAAAVVVGSSLLGMATPGQAQTTDPTMSPAAGAASAPATAPASTPAAAGTAAARPGAAAASADCVLPGGGLRPIPSCAPTSASSSVDCPLPGGMPPDSLALVPATPFGPFVFAPAAVLGCPAPVVVRASDGQAQVLAAVNRGDAAGALALLADDATYAISDGVGLCGAAPCVGKEAIRRELERQVGVHTVFLARGFSETGNTAMGFWEVRSDRVPQSGGQRLLLTVSSEVRNGKVSALRLNLLRDDAQTAAFIAWAAAQPMTAPSGVPASAPMTSPSGSGSGSGSAAPAAAPTPATVPSSPPVGTGSAPQP